MRIKLLAAAAVLVVGIGATASQASTITCTGNQSTTYTLEVSGAAACGLSNNDSAAALGAIPGLFQAPPPWTLSDKSDDNTTTGLLSFTASSSFADGSTSGIWEIDAFPQFTQIAIVLKAGNTFSAFLLTPYTTDGRWFTDRGLSHASLYYRSCQEGDPGCGTPGVVPLPAAGWLLLAGVGGLAAIRRRRKAA